MRRLLALGLALSLLGCASSGAFRAGGQAERRQDWDRAVVEYSRALSLAPQNRHYRAALERARLRASAAHVAQGRQLAARRAWKEAIEEFRLALDLTPTAADVARALTEVEQRQRTGQPGRTVEELKDRARERALPGLELDAAGRQPLGLSFRGASLREAYQTLGRVAGVNFVFDPQFQDQAVTLDLRDVPFEQALAALGTAGRCFHRVSDGKILTVVPDTAAKRREYEQQVVKTFFLSNADLKEAIDLLRIVLGARRVASVPGANALTINDTPEKVAAAERILDVVDKARAEVVVDVELMEVNRGRLQEYGIEITSAVPNVSGVAGAVFPDPQQTFTIGDNPYAKDNLVISSLPGVIYRLLRTDASTRLLANPQLRASEGQTAQARFGDQVPVPVTTFAPIAQGGITQQPITSFEYKNVGVNIDLTPRVHHDDDVTLTLKVDISALGPAGYQGLPTFTSRQVNSTIRLRDGETNVLAGLISDSERRSLSGLPWLAGVPVLGRLFARNKDELAETDILLTLTPRIVRRAQLREQDLRSFVLGAGETGAALLFEAPSVPGPPGAPGERGSGPRVEPIRPPQSGPAPAPSPTPYAPDR